MRFYFDNNIIILLFGSPCENHLPISAQWTQIGTVCASIYLNLLEQLLCRSVSLSFLSLRPSIPLCSLSTQTTAKSRMKHETNKMGARETSQHILLTSSACADKFTGRYILIAFNRYLFSSMKIKYITNVIWHNCAFKTLQN